MVLLVSLHWHYATAFEIRTEFRTVLLPLKRRTVEYELRFSNFKVAPRFFTTKFKIRTLCRTISSIIMILNMRRNSHKFTRSRRFTTIAADFIEHVAFACWCQQNVYNYQQYKRACVRSVRVVRLIVIIISRRTSIVGHGSRLMDESIDLQWLRLEATYFESVLTRGSVTTFDF